MKNSFAPANAAGLIRWARCHRRVLGLSFAVVAVLLAALWVFVVPAKAEETSGWRELTLQWAHPACWALLAVVGLLVATGGPKRLRDAAALGAVACYALFLAGVVL